MVGDTAPPDENVDTTGIAKVDWFDPTSLTKPAVDDRVVFTSGGEALTVIACLVDHLELQVHNRLFPTTGLFRCERTGRLYVGNLHDVSSLFRFNPN